MTTDKNELLSALGFIKGTGFDGEVWTNTDSEVMTQVWIYFSGDFKQWELNYDARNGFDFAHFFKWWEHVTDEERGCPCCGR